MINRLEPQDSRSHSPPEVGTEVVLWVNKCPPGGFRHLLSGWVYSQSLHRVQRSKLLLLKRKIQISK